jgi:hypothetical protein
MPINLENHRLQNDEPENTGGGGVVDTPLGEKGQKALEAEKQKARELAKKTKELEEKLKAFEGLDLNAVQEALKFQQEAALREAEAKANTEEARKLEREQAAAEKKRLQADKEQAEKEKLAARQELTETRIDAAIALNLANTGIKPQYTGLLTKDQEFRSQLAYMTKAADGVDVDGIYVVDKSGDPRYHPDDRNKYLPIDLWIETEVAKKYPDMFAPRVGTGDGLSGRRGKRSGGVPTEELAKMKPEQRAEWSRLHQSR